MVIHKKGDNFEINMTTARFDAGMKKAQMRLNMLIVGDSEPFIPFQQGELRSAVRYPQGLSGDEIEWYAPYAHYQYYGNVYTDAYGRTWVNKGETKPINSGRPLVYNQPGTTDYWFESAKQAHKAEWLKEVKILAGGN